MGQPLSVFFSAQRSEDYDEGGEAYLTFNGKCNFPSISYYFHIPKIFLNFFPHTGKNRNRRKSNLLP